MPPSATAQPAAHPTRCVVWGPPGHPPDDHLRSALRRPALDVRIASDDLGAIAAMLDGCATRTLATDTQPRILLLVEPQRLAHLHACVDVLSCYIQDLTLWVFDAARTDVLRTIDRTALATLAPPPPGPTAAASTFKPQGSAGQTHIKTVATSPTLNLAPGQTAWVGPWTTTSAMPSAGSGSEQATTPPPALRLTTDPSSAAALPKQAIQSTREDHEKDREPVQSDPSAAQPLLTDEELAMLLGDDRVSDDPPRVARS